MLLLLEVLSKAAVKCSGQSTKAPAQAALSPQQHPPAGMELHPASALHRAQRIELLEQPGPPCLQVGAAAGYEHLTRLPEHAGTSKGQVLLRRWARLNWRGGMCMPDHVLRLVTQQPQPPASPQAGSQRLQQLLGGDVQQATLVRNLELTAYPRLQQQGRAEHAGGVEALTLQRREACIALQEMRLLAPGWRPPRACNDGFDTASCLQLQAVVAPQ